MTPALHAQAARSRQALEQSLAETGMSAEAAAVEVFLLETFGPTDGDDGPAGGTRPDAPGKGPRGGGGGNRRTPSGKGTQGRRALGGKGKRASAEASERPLEEADLNKVRSLAQALGDAQKLSARNVRQTIGCRNDYAVRLRDAVQGEQRNN
jgi:hypothetical protein